MAQAGPGKLRTVEEVEIPAFEGESAKDADSARAVQTLLLLLKVASQRTVIALSNLVTLAGLGTGFWLALTILPKEPSVNQLVGLGLYGAFVVAVRFVWRK